MNFDVPVIATIRKIPLDRRLRDNYTRRSQEVGDYSGLGIQKTKAQTLFTAPHTLLDISFR